jgi:hypothetical protein
MTEQPQGFILREKVDALAAAILSRHPTMPSLLQQIHSTLSKYPEQVTLLSEDDIKIVVNGLEMQTQTHLASQVSSGSSKSAKGIASKLTKLGDDAL